MAIFEPLDAANHWRPSALAAGPFAGLQGGAVASLLTAEVEAVSAERKWGTAVSVTAWFLRPTPMANLRTQLSVVTEGGRVSVIDNTLWPIDAEQPCATVRVTLSRERAVELPGFADQACDPTDPTRFPVRTRKAAHGRPWFMDAMEARAGDDVAWFRLHHPIIAGAGPLSSVLGPADWTHGISRPLQDVVARPDPVAAGHRVWGGKRDAARHARRDWPRLDVGRPGAISESGCCGGLAHFPVQWLILRDACFASSSG